MDMSSRISASDKLRLPRRISPCIRASMVHRAYSLQRSRSSGRPTKTACPPMCSITHPAATADLRKACCPEGFLAHSSSADVSVTDVVSMPKMTSNSCAPSRSSLVQAGGELLHTPGHVRSEAAITLKAQARLFRSGPMATNNLGVDSHSWRCLSSFAAARTSCAGSSCSVPSKSQLTSIVPGLLPGPNSVAECQAPSNLACTPASGSMAMPPKGTLPGTSRSGSVVSGGNQTAITPVSS
mmetsp:Transcript_9829/g.21780  ORF Transcript_9829/g.21780 Transcript_9829/m.21780 type:complete len:240 (+) Transcript_9829:646-1365(+)